MATYKLLLLPGDGIGPEVMGEVKKLIAWMNGHGMGTFETEEGLVGGSCFGSPTMIVCRARAIAPTASHVVICEASSKITTSNSAWFGGKYWAIESGDISMQGASFGKACGILPIMSRIDWLGLCNCIWWRRSPSSEFRGTPVTGKP